MRLKPVKLALALAAIAVGGVTMTAAEAASADFAEGGLLKVFYFSDGKTLSEEILTWRDPDAPHMKCMAKTSYRSSPACIEVLGAASSNSSGSVAGKLLKIFYLKNGERRTEELLTWMEPDASQHKCMVKLHYRASPVCISTLKQPNSSSSKN